MAYRIGKPIWSKIRTCMIDMGVKYVIKRNIDKSVTVLEKSRLRETKNL